MKNNAENLLHSYIDALHPIIYINHFDFQVVDDMLTRIGKNVKILEFNNALGLIDFKTKSPLLSCNLETYLHQTMDEGYDQQTYLVLKDVHTYLNDSNIIALLKRIAEDNMYRDNYYTTIFIVASKLVVPEELENYITIFDFPNPNNEEIAQIISDFSDAVDVEVDQDTLNEIALSLKGLNEFQIKQILNLAYQDGGKIDGEDKFLILQEKEQFIKKSGMLEMVNFKETIDDIGGLENLKEWLFKKSKVFHNLDKALKFGVDLPKGIMIIGMPGCGKSLTAKATARLFESPLVRLDVGRLLGKYVGESEDNMRKALKAWQRRSAHVCSGLMKLRRHFQGLGMMVETM